MAINKVMRRSGEVLLDLSTDTVTPETLMSGVTAHNAAGEAIQGTFTLDSELTTQDNLISQIQTALQNKAAGSEPVLQSKTVTPSASIQEVKPDNGYDGLSQVTVNAMTTATQATPSITVSTSGLITASATQTEGYVTGGTKSATKQLTTQAAKTITPSNSSQTAVAKNVYTTGAVTVAAIPSTYVKPTTTKSATTYTPSTSNQTIAAGTYCSGAQTIKGDSNLKAENIKSGVSIFGVAGSYEGSGGGSSGGGVESCIVNYVTDYKPMPLIKLPTITYTTPEMAVETVNYDPMYNGSWEVAKNTIMIVLYTERQYPVSGEGQIIFAGIGYQAIKVTGDCTFGTVGGTNPA